MPSQDSSDRNQCSHIGEHHNKDMIEDLRRLGQLFLDQFILIFKEGRSPANPRQLNDRSPKINLKRRKTNSLTDLTSKTFKREHSSRSSNKHNARETHSQRRSSSRGRSLKVFCRSCGSKNLTYEATCQDCNTNYRTRTEKAVGILHKVEKGLWRRSQETRHDKNRNSKCVYLSVKEFFQEFQCKSECSEPISAEKSLCCDKQSSRRFNQRRSKSPRRRSPRRSLSRNRVSHSNDFPKHTPKGWDKNRRCCSAQRQNHRNAPFNSFGGRKEHLVKRLRVCAKKKDVYLQSPTRFNSLRFRTRHFGASKTLSLIDNNIEDLRTTKSNNEKKSRNLPANTIEHSSQKSEDIPMQYMKPKKESKDLPVDSKKSYGISTEKVTYISNDECYERQVSLTDCREMNYVYSESNIFKDTLQSIDIQLDTRSIADKLAEFCDVKSPLSPLDDVITDDYQSPHSEQCNIIDTFIYGSSGEDNLTDRDLDNQKSSDDKDCYGNVQAPSHETKDWLTDDDKTRYQVMPDESEDTLNTQSQIEHASGVKLETNTDCKLITPKEKDLTNHGGDIQIDVNNSSDEKNEPIPESDKESIAEPSLCFDDEYEAISFSYEYDMLKSPIVLNASDRVYHIKNVADGEIFESANEGTSTNEEDKVEVSAILNQVRKNDDLLSTAMASAGLTESAVAEFMDASFDLDTVIFEEDIINSHNKRTDADEFLDNILHDFSTTEYSGSTNFSKTENLAISENMEQTPGKVLQFASFNKDGICQVNVENGFHVAEELGSDDVTLFRLEKSNSCWTTESYMTQSSLEDGCSRSYFETMNNPDITQQMERASDMWNGSADTEIQSCLQDCDRQTTISTSTPESSSPGDIANPRNLYDPADSTGKMKCPKKAGTLGDIAMVYKLNNKTTVSRSKGCTKGVKARELVFTSAEEESIDQARYPIRSRRKKGEQEEGLRPRSSSRHQPNKSPRRAKTKSTGKSKSRTEYQTEAESLTKYRRPHVMLRRSLRYKSTTPHYPVDSVMLPSSAFKCANANFTNSNNNGDNLDNSFTNDDAMEHPPATKIEKEHQRRDVAIQLKLRCKELEEQSRKRYQSPYNSAFKNAMLTSLSTQNKPHNSKQRITPEHDLETDKHFAARPKRITDKQKKGSQKEKDGKIKASVIKFVKRIQGEYGDQFPVSRKTSKEERHDICNKYLAYHGIRSTVQSPINETKEEKKSTLSECSKINEGENELQMADEEDVKCSIYHSDSFITESNTSISSNENENIQKCTKTCADHSRSNRVIATKNMAHTKVYSSSETNIHTSVASSRDSSKPSTSASVISVDHRLTLPNNSLLRKFLDFENAYQQRLSSTVIETPNRDDDAQTIRSHSKRSKRNCSQKSPKKLSESNSVGKTKRTQKMLGILDKFESLDKFIDDSDGSSIDSEKTERKKTKTSTVKYFQGANILKSSTSDSPLKTFAQPTEKIKVIEHQLFSSGSLKNAQAQENNKLPMKRSHEEVPTCSNDSKSEINDSLRKDASATKEYWTEKPSDNHDRLDINDKTSNRKNNRYSPKEKISDAPLQPSVNSYNPISQTKTHALPDTTPHGNNDLKLPVLTKINTPNSVKKDGQYMHVSFESTTKDTFYSCSDLPTLISPFNKSRNIAGSVESEQTDSWDDLWARGDGENFTGPTNKMETSRITSDTKSPITSDTKSPITSDTKSPITSDTKSPIIMPNSDDSETGNTETQMAAVENKTEFEVKDQSLKHSPVDHVFLENKSYHEEDKGPDIPALELDNQDSLPSSRHPRLLDTLCMLLSPIPEDPDDEPIS